MDKVRFEWSDAKNHENLRKHGVGFGTAQHAFLDRNRVIAVDALHSVDERRYFCFGAIAGEILTVRFTYRIGAIRIFGAGYWRKGKVTYERENQIYE